MGNSSVLTRTKKAKAEALFNSNQLEEAKTIYESICKVDKIDIDSWTKLGVIARRLGSFKQSEGYFRHILSVKPDFATAYQGLGAALQCQGRMDEAIESYRRAIQISPATAEAHYFLANALKDTGKLIDSVDHYKKAIEHRPGFLEALSNLGAALVLLGLPQEALVYLSQAQRINPNVPQVWCNLGNVFMLEGAYEKASKMFHQALSITPDFVDAFAKLAELNEKLCRVDEAKHFVERGMKIEPHHAALNLVASKIARSEKRFTEAVEYLKSIPMSNIPPEVAGDIHLNLGMLYDRLGDTNVAFLNIEMGNQLLAKTLQVNEHDRDEYFKKIADFSKYFNKNLALQSAQHMVADNEVAPIFLMGFPRSGTTLLDQILDSHPKLQTLEEKPTVSVMKKVFLDMTSEDENALADLKESEIAHLQAAYFGEVSKHITLKPGMRLVDKMPLNTLNAHLIWRVFPNAKVILAIRHPCDVCLSCFMQNFAFNEAMSIFYNLQASAQFYAKVMGLWNEFVSALPIDYHIVRYEDVVADFETETRKLLRFLELEWDDAVLDHTEHARNRGTINTPSYHQVTQPIYQHAKYRWERYANQMESVTRILLPFIRQFRYLDK